MFQGTNQVIDCSAKQSNNGIVHWNVKLLQHGGPMEPIGLGKIRKSLMALNSHKCSVYDGIFTYVWMMCRA